MALEDRNLGPASLAIYFCRDELVDSFRLSDFSQALAAGLDTALHRIGWGQVLDRAALRMWSLLEV